VACLFWDREKYQLIDLTLPIQPFMPDIVGHVKMAKWNHEQGARLNSVPTGIDPIDFPPGPPFYEYHSQAWEELTLTTHIGTHLDAPWHFFPTTENGKMKAKTIDEVPLEWCIGNGVVLDVRHVGPGGLITEDDVKEALKKINYKIQPWDIVLIQTGWDKKWGTKEYFENHPGMSREATLYLIEQGVKVMGIDAFGFDRAFKVMGEEYKRTGDKNVLWPAHNVGREKEYLHLERLANLDKIPKPTGFTVVVFPIKIEGASAGWVRAVAIVEKE